MAAMRLQEMLLRDQEAGLLVCEQAHDLVHGAVRLAEEWGGWTRPWRFAPEQVRALGSCQAWHPGLYRQMARTTAGVTIEFDTDSTEVYLEVLLDDEPTGTRQVLDPIRRAAGTAGPLDGISADVDGRHLDARMPDEPEGVVAFSLDDPDAAPSPDLMMLPGFGDEHHVRIWLPALRGCAVRRLWGNGSHLRPVDRREVLLVLGDSVAQGFVAGDPAIAWPSLLSTSLGLDVVNQGVGGQVFQPGTLLGLAKLVDPQTIVVALGDNYRYEPCRSRQVAADIRAYLDEVSRAWPDVPTYVCTPPWHDEQASASHPKSCWQRVPSMIAANAAAHSQMELVDGLRLHDRHASALADADGHPNQLGAAQMARRLRFAMEGLGAEDLEATGYDDMLRVRALRLLKDAPRVALPLAETLRRGIGKVLFAQEGCILLRVDDGRSMAYAPDASLGETVVSMLVDTPCLDVLGAGLAEPAARALGILAAAPCRVAVYRRSTPVRMPIDKEVRVLDESFAEVVRAHCASDVLSDDQLAASLGRGDFLGGFEGDELVGIVGEHPDGSFGLLEVFEGHRGNCWGQALESAKVNQSLERGQVPWCKVSPDDEASLALQRSLGLALGHVGELCSLGAPIEVPA